MIRSYSCGGANGHGVIAETVVAKVAIVVGQQYAKSNAKAFVYKTALHL